MGCVAAAGSVEVGAMTKVAVAVAVLVAVAPPAAGAAEAEKPHAEAGRGGGEREVAGTVRVWAAAAVPGAEPAARVEPAALAAAMAVAAGGEQGAKKVEAVEVETGWRLVRHAPLPTPAHRRRIRRSVMDRSRRACARCGSSSHQKSLPSPRVACRRASFELCSRSAS